MILQKKLISHEYFHNWSGNRVTIKDWFEFTLKEGLTTFRDQEYMTDKMSGSSGQGNSSIVSRIESIKILREKQFVEDSNKETRHSIRPEYYKIKIDSSNIGGGQQHCIPRPGSI